MTYNKIYVSFGALRKITGPFISYQYDVQQILVINGLNLPEYYEVDFCNDGDTYTETIVGTVDGGVAIPNKFLRTGKKVKAYLVLVGDGDVQTRYEITLPVNVRPQRQDIDPTDDQQLQIDSLVAALNSGVSRAEAAAQRAEDASTHTPQIVDGYWYLWDSDTEQYVSTGVKAAGIDGNDGVGISSVRLNADYTLTLVFTDESEYTTPISIRGPKGDPFRYEDFTEAQKAELVQGPILDAQRAAIEAVNTAGTTQTGNVNQAGTTNVNAVNQAGTTQVNAVNQAGATQVQAVEDKGDEVLDSIPQDYTDLVDDVADLSRQLSDLEDTVSTTQIINTASGAIASFDDGADGQPIKKLVAQIEPVQDLHGYDHPWPAGGGANKFGGDALKTALLTVTGATEGSDANGNYVNLPASGTLNNVILFSDFEENQQYTIIFKILPTGSHASNIRVYYADNTAQTFSTSGDGQLGTVSYTTAVGKTVESIKLGYWYSSTCKVYYDSCGVFVGADQTYSPYSNICPISGHTGAEIYNTGKNLLKCTINTQTLYGVTFTVNADGTITADGKATTQIVLTTGVLQRGIEGRTVVYSGCTGGSADTYSINAKVNGAYRGDVYNGDSAIPITINNNTVVEYIIVVRAGATVSNVVFKPMFRYTTESPDYEPPITVRRITFPETIYGGEDEVISGKLVVDTFNGVIGNLIGDGYVYNQSDDFYYGYLPSAFPTPAKNGGIFNFLRSSNPNINNHDCAYVFVSRMIRINISQLERSAEAYRAYFAQNPLQIVYSIAPIEYQLTPQELDTLYGTNNIWANTGDTEVTYPADTKLYIENLTKPEEDDMTANANIAANTFFMIGNTLYFSTAAIAQGATIIPGTNCNVVSLADALNQLNT